eukprot:764395-Pelagomonas_calceolata.AAC.2
MPSKAELLQAFEDASLSMQGAPLTSFEDSYDYMTSCYCCSNSSKTNGIILHILLFLVGFAGELDYDKEMSALERKGQQPNKQQGKAKDRMQPGKSKALTNKQRAAKDAKYGRGFLFCVSTDRLRTALLASRP